MRQEAIFAGRYLLERRAGAGGMGEVWKALDQETGEAVAVKVLPGGAAEYAQRFTREAQILARLAHPRVVRYVAHGANADGAPYLVMEWLDGEDLAARLARGPLSVEESVGLAIEVATMLAFAHERAVVHRDLKPSNLFLPGGRLDAVKVLDFGIARADLATRMTRTGMLMGTPGYMAPEQARGEANIDARADVFSLGCVLFECLTGEPAFGGKHAAAILTKVLFEETPSVRSVRPEVPEALDDLLRSMLSKRREERPEGGQAAASALRTLVLLPSERPGGTGRARSLTGSEQRAMAVILVSAPADVAATPLHEDSTLAVAPDATALLQEAEKHGGAGERLIDGSVVVVMAGAGLATDLCAQAARCALALRAHAGGRQVALAMGRGERTVRSMGPAIDRAARLSGAHDAASRDVVAIDDVVAGLLDARFEVQEADGFFTLHGERLLAEGTRLLLGKATPCVGREHELATLRALFAESVEEGMAQAALVVAPPGVGKSRLAQEFLQKVRERDEATSIWVARGDALRAGSPLGMLGQALRSACGIREGDPLEIRREKLSAQVATWVSPNERRRVAEFLGEIVGVPFPDEESLPLRAARLDAQLMAGQVRAAFLDFVGAACEKAPVLVLLEDLHWGDRTTVQLLDAALRKMAASPLVVLALARPEVVEVFPNLWEERRLHELRLVELSRRAGERLARHALGERADPEVITRIVRLSEGNAFYLEELIRWTAEGKGADMPETVVAMVESRLGALDEGARRLLRAASVFGEVFWAGGVAALLGGEARRGGVLAGLATLVEREILVRRRESRFPGEEEFAFRHALLREGAYAMLTEGDRTLGHGLAGDWLVLRGEPDSVVLAEHFEKGMARDKAGVYWLRAVKQTSWGVDPARTFLCIERGLACPMPTAMRLELLGALCEAYCFYRMAEVGAALPYAAEILGAAEPGSGPWAQAQVIRLHGAIHARQTETFATVVRELMGAQFRPEAIDPALLSLTTAAYMLDHVGDIPTANVVFERLRAIALEVAAIAPNASVYRDMVACGRSCQVMEDPWSGLSSGRNAMERARAMGHRTYLSASQVLTATAAYVLGAYAEARRLFDEVVVPDEEISIVSSVRPFTLAWLLADQGALDEAKVWAERLLAVKHAQAFPLDQARGHWALAEVRRRAGDFEGAEAELLAALPFFTAHCPVDAPGALATLAAVRLASGRPTEALAPAVEGLTRYEALGSCYLLRGSFVQLVHAECLEATGAHEAAKEAITTARRRVFRIADTIGDPGYRKSFLEYVPENRRTLELARQWLGEGG